MVWYTHTHARTHPAKYILLVLCPLLRFVILLPFTARFFFLSPRGTGGRGTILLLPLLLLLFYPVLRVVVRVRVRVDPPRPGPSPAPVVHPSPALTAPRDALTS